MFYNVLTNALWLLGSYNAVRILISYDEHWRHYAILHAGQYGLLPLAIDIASQWVWFLIIVVFCFAWSLAIIDGRRTKLDLLLRWALLGAVSVFLPPALLNGWFWLIT